MAEFSRERALAHVRAVREPWDVVVVGGGATGVGSALDAASRGYRVVLFEQGDFGQGTSSRSTKLVHGGVRYLRQGNLPLVAEALRERARLARNAPHLVAPLEFVVPAYRRWEVPWFGLGLSLYDALAAGRALGRSRRLDARGTRTRVPNLRAEGLRGGRTYVDARFDDARLLIHLARTAAEHGAILVNRARVVALGKDHGGRVRRVTVRDEETGADLGVAARVVLNATGPFTDEVRRLGDAGVEPWMAPSQGVHLVLDGAFLGGTSALLVPRTEDGRVLFVVPWHGRALVGTTDTPVADVALEPRATAEEVAFLLRTAGRYLARAPRREDVLGVFTGIRPLVRSARTARTAALSRDHRIEVSPAGLVTVAGGKWTTYRKMAQDAVDVAARVAGLPPRRCATRDLPVHGHDREAWRHGRLAHHGSDAPRVAALVASDPAHARRVHPRLEVSAGEVVWAVREEMARTVDDVLCRRTPSLHLDARAAREAAPAVAALLAAELGRDAAWQRDQVRRFDDLAALALPPADAEPASR